MLPTVVMQLSQPIKLLKLQYEVHFWRAVVQDCGAKRLGFTKDYWQSSHLRKPEIEQILSIPVHRNQDLKIGTLRALMKIAQLSEKDLL